jgi:hypothetical protein
MTDILISIGGEGEQVELNLKIVGCDCRREDFIFALVKFANQWKAVADAAAPTSTMTVKPCGCQDAK